MPTLVWIRRSESGPDADDAKSRRRGCEDSAVPDPVVYAASAAAAAAAPDDVAAAAAVMPPACGVPPPFTTQKMGPYHHHPHHNQRQRQRKRQQPLLLRRHGTADDGTTTTSSKHDGRRTKRKTNHAGQATAAKKKSKATPGLVLPTGVYKRPSGKFESRIRWCGKLRFVGTFDTAETASAACMSVRKDLDDAKLWRCGADADDDILDAARTKAREAAHVSRKNELPRGVAKTRSEKFQARITLCGKAYYVGTFDTPEQASAAFMSVKKDLDDANLSAVGADEIKALFDAAKEKARVSIKGNVSDTFPQGFHTACYM